MLLDNAPDPAGYSFFCGIDPGFSGGIVVMNAAGSSVRAYDMPVREAGKTKTYHTLDPVKLKHIVSGINRFPYVLFALENPTTRPGEGAERSFRFGRQLGGLDATLLHSGADYVLVPPNLWKSRLGLNGKDRDPLSEQGVALFEQEYPRHVGLIRGPRGGLLDGRLDAALIAHALRIGVLHGKFSAFVSYGKRARKSG